ncbi:type 1 glutamine amidotransferase [Streptosporangium carneum]|uniref:Lipid II isoglutaminyl synthase (glutamine-hydrolyzing) subunit GatD n=1 Tax=Streptosporangium carneum TaxID=47481 RepID=A0A9W6I2B7_9ACTN|nr:glutamine amidotransferase [Streptosporangium carneum]GLK10398.1 glutamine amidotransferase [Streptosporangium carneum]
MQSDSVLRLVWIYPDLLSTYGDQGNVLVLEQRAQRRGIPVETVHVRSADPVPEGGDIYLIGGGEDRPQILAAERLRRDGGLNRAIARGAALLAVCAGYQIMGTTFGGEEGQPVDGIGLIDIASGRGQGRAVGELAGEADPVLGIPTLTGFENHMGVTRLGSGVRPLARTAVGIGNGDGTEGCHAGKIVGTYLHGPALARNPGLADLLLTWAVGAQLPPIDDSWFERLRQERLAAVLPQ